MKKLFTVAAILLSLATYAQDSTNLVDALNFMGKDGWKLVNAFPITISGSGNVYHFFFKKEFAKQDAGVQ